MGLKKRLTSISACMLVVALGLSSYPVYATDTTGESYEQVEDTNAKMAHQLPADDVVFDNVEPNDDVKPQAEVEPEDDVEPPTDDSTTIILANDNISSNVPKLDDLASDESQLVIPQGEDEYDYSPFSGITPYSMQLMDGVTLTGGTPGVDYRIFHYQMTILRPGRYELDSLTGAISNYRITIQANDVQLHFNNMRIESPKPVKIEGRNASLWFTRSNSLTGTDAAPIETDFDTELISNNWSDLTLHRTVNAEWGLLASNGDARRINLHEMRLTLDQTAPHYFWNFVVGSAKVTTTGLTTINRVPVHHNTQPMPNLHPYVYPREIAFVPTNSVPRVFGNILYSVNNGPWATQPWDTFWDLEPGTTYTIRAKYAAFSGVNESPVATMTITTPIEYTVNIPATMQADGTSVDITVGDHLVLGASGRLDITINGGTIQDNGRLQLQRLNSGDMIRSQLLVDDEIFNVRIGGVRQSVATFTMTNQDPVPISFVAPNEANIPAGTYEGTVVFEISYSN